MRRRLAAIAAQCASSEKGSVMTKISMLCRLFPLASLAAMSGAAQAGDSTHVGVALTGGLSGIGADVAVNINDYVGIRGTIAGFNISHTGDYGTSVSWDATLKLFQAGALVDLYPFAGGFRLSAGVVQDGNKFTMSGKPASGNYTFNGNTYAAADLGSASATVDWSKAVPYVGLGWGNLGGSPGLHFTGDLGMLITGSPNATINATCSAAGQTAGICAQLATDAAAEQVKMQNNVHSITVWPVLRLGVGYTF